MLPKPEKGKKKDKVSPSGEQLDLLGSLNHEEKTKKNRFWVAFLLIVTIIPSLGFWIFRSVRSHKPVSFPRPSFNLPMTAKQSSTSLTDLGSIVDPLIANDPNSWSVFVLTLPEGPSSFQWGRSTDALFSGKSQGTILAELEKSPPLETSSLLSRLPQGSQIREISQSSEGTYQLNSLITVPNKRIMLLVGVFGSSDIEVSKNMIPSLSESIYWHIMSLD